MDSNVKARDFFKAVLFSTIIFGTIIYFSFSFICADFNPMTWHVIARVIFVLLMIGIIIMSIKTADEEVEKQLKNMEKD